MIGEGGSCEKDLRLIGIVSEARGGIMEEMNGEFKSVGKGWKGDIEVVRGASFTSGFDIMQIGWFRLMEKIVSNRYNFVSYALLPLQPVKQFECRSDV